MSNRRAVNLRQYGIGLEKKRDADRLADEEIRQKEAEGWLQQLMGGVDMAMPWLIRAGKKGLDFATGGLTLPFDYLIEPMIATLAAKEGSSMTEGLLRKMGFGGDVSKIKEAAGFWGKKEGQQLAKNLEEVMKGDEKSEWLSAGLAGISGTGGFGKIGKGLYKDLGKLGQVIKGVEGAEKALPVKFPGTLAEMKQAAGMPMGSTTTGKAIGGTPLNQNLPFPTSFTDAKQATGMTMGMTDTGKAIGVPGPKDILLDESILAGLQEPIETSTFASQAAPIEGIGQGGDVLNRPKGIGTRAEIPNKFSGATDAQGLNIVAPQGMQTAPSMESGYTFDRPQQISLAEAMGFKPSPMEMQGQQNLLINQLQNQLQTGGGSMANNQNLLNQLIQLIGQGQR